ncbi:hypothetical protein IFR05_013452 [Cadophora sp. M221]|nr:hypothetical protein IFR05_013452 [Cadophora sp. M221]
MNQIPATPYRPKNDRVEWCRSKSIHITVWGSLTIDRATQYNVASDHVAQKIASSVNITPVQLVLSWAIERHERYPEKLTRGEASIQSCR